MRYKELIVSILSPSLLASPRAATPLHVSFSPLPSDRCPPPPSHSSVCTLNPTTMEILGLFRGDTVIVRYVHFLWIGAMEEERRGRRRWNTRSLHVAR